MTVANNYAPIRQIGNNSTTQFSAAWSMIAAAYALVQLEDSTTGVRTLVNPGAGATQYQIAITSSGFTVTMGTAPTSSQYINVSRVTGLSQTGQYRTSKGFQGEVEENSFDKLTAMVQDARYTAGLAITIPSGEMTSTLLPSAAIRASGYLTFDASGNVTVSTGPSGVAVSVAMTPVVQAASLATALSLLGAAPLASPTFTGVPIVPTAAGTTNTTQAASTAMVQAAIAAATSKQLNNAFLTSGTSWTSPSNITASTVFKITLIGGGGGCASNGGAIAGGAGAQVYWWKSGLTASTAYAYAIGAGGSNTGGTGGATNITIGTTPSAGGGVGSGTGTGGAASGGTINVPGQNGTGSAGSSAGTGGSTPYGGGSSFSATSGNPAVGYGAGAGGEAAQAGTQGMILIEWVA